MFRYINSKLPPNRLSTLMKALQPTITHHENVHKLYESLQERIGVVTADTSKAEPMDQDFDSPLKNVPTPGPHYV